MERISTASRALFSATYSDSDRRAKLSLICTSCSPRPSAASRLSSGMVYPLAFFQLEMQGGIFQSIWSLTVTGRGGECMTGTGGDPLALGTRLWRNLGGSIGSTGISTILMMRSLAPELKAAPCWLGVYLMIVASPGRPGMDLGCAAESFTLTIFSSAAFVRCVASATSSSSGLGSSLPMSSILGTRSRCCE